jgi:hypothetical protein
MKEEERTPKSKDLKLALIESYDENPNINVVL